MLFILTLRPLDRSMVDPPLPPSLPVEALDAQPVCDVPPRSLGGSGDSDNLPPLQAVVARDGVSHLDSGQLRLLHSVPLEQSVLLLLGKDLVLRHQYVLRDVHQELLLLELLDEKLGGEDVLNRGATRRDGRGRRKRASQSQRWRPRRKTPASGCQNLLCPTCSALFAKAVRAVGTTRMAFETSASFIFSAYSLIFFTPTFASFGKKTKIWLSGSSLSWAKMVSLSLDISSPSQNLSMEGEEIVRWVSRGRSLGKHSSAKGDYSLVLELVQGDFRVVRVDDVPPVREHLRARFAYFVHAEDLLVLHHGDDKTRGKRAAAVLLTPPPQCSLSGARPHAAFSRPGERMWSLGRLRMRSCAAFHSVKDITCNRPMREGVTLSD